MTLVNVRTRQQEKLVIYITTSFPYLWPTFVLQSALAAGLFSIVSLKNKNIFFPWVTAKYIPVSLSPSSKKAGTKSCTYERLSALRWQAF